MAYVVELFVACVDAINRGELITREGKNDKEFHFQNWFRRRLEVAKLDFDAPGRNSYPDFRLVYSPEGYEIKGLAYPGRDATYDCNSQVPAAAHHGRTVSYVFGRYPKNPDGNSYPVVDLVMCHGSFLNADTEYVHKNKSVKGFGSYGDIMIRDRKMYVAPTPFALAQGTAHRRTLILPADIAVPPTLIEVGTLTRTEVADVVVAYQFDLRTREISATRVRNPSAGREHVFRAFRVAGDPPDRVTLRDSEEVMAAVEQAAEIDE